VGPNKTGFKGLIQPILDGVKLIMKEAVFLNKRSFVFVVAPSLIFVVIILLLLVVDRIPIIVPSVGFLFFLRRVAVTVFSTLLAGWSRFSKYSLLGSVRSVAQRVSYEVIARFVVLSCFVCGERVEGGRLCYRVSGLSLGLIVGELFLFGLLETNRAPFDFAEGERELISGFNLEYSRIGFVLLFLGEYGMIIFFSFLISFLLMGRRVRGIFFFLFLFILVRSATIPCGIQSFGSWLEPRYIFAAGQLN